VGKNAESLNIQQVDYGIRGIPTSGLKMINNSVVPCVKD